MKTFLIRAAGWFTDARRQALQALVASAVSLLVILGAVTGVQSSALLDLSASFLLALQGALGLFLLRRGDRYTWLNTKGRGAIYSLGAAVGVVGFTFSLWSESASGLIVQVATVLASILVGALQMVNAGTLASTPLPDLEVTVEADASSLMDAFNRTARSSDAARPIEASPATFAKERKPGLRVGVFWPFLPRVDRDRVSDSVDAAFPDAETVYLLTSAAEFQGLSVDVVLVTVPLTRALVEVFESNVAASSFDGQRVQHLEVG